MFRKKLQIIRPLRIYLARGMSGRVKADVVAEAAADREFFTRAGFNVLCPVTEEGVQASNDKLIADPKLMAAYWPRDKQMIQQADVIVDTTPNLLSQGVMHEIGLARYCYWKPVVRMFPTGKLPDPGNVAFFEDDVVVDSREEVVEALYRLWGTPKQRWDWRVTMLRRCIRKWIRLQIQFLKDTVN